MNKLPALILIVLFACSAFSCIAIQSVNASPNIPVPQFTVRYVDESYDASTQPSIDPYTGETIQSQNYHVNRKYLQVIFLDSPPSPADSHSEYYYNIRIKGQYTSDWTETRTASDGYYNPSVFRTVNFSLTAFSIIGKDLPDGTKIDFQVQLMYGGIGKDLSEGPLGSLYFVGETSGWSNTKTVTIGDTSFDATEPAAPTQTPTVEPTPTPTAEPTATSTPAANSSQQGIQWSFQTPTDWQTVLIVVLAAVVALLVVVVIVQRGYGSRKKETSL